MRETHDNRAGLNPVNDSQEDNGSDRQKALKPSRKNVILGSIAVLSIIAICVPAKLWRPQTCFTIRENIQIAEAQSWWQGRLDLPERKWDSALYQGKIYSHFPPAFTLVSAVIVPIFGGVPHWFVLLVIVLPIPLLAYSLLLRQSQSVGWAVLLTVGLVCGTSLLPVLDKTLRGCHPYVINQCLSAIGLLIMLIEVLGCGRGRGRRRFWILGPALMLSAWSRQLTIVYAMVLIYLAFQREGLGTRKIRLIQLVGTGVIIAALPCMLNALKFGHPLDSGYMHIYNDRPGDRFSQDAQTHGIFSTHYIKRNLYYANLGFPVSNVIEVEGKKERYYRPNHMATGIWWTTPLLLLMLPNLRKLWADPLSRVLLVSAGLVFVALMFYHSTGFDQRGLNRYSLDYLIVCFTLVVPYVLKGKARWFTVGAILWSVLYFVKLMPMPHWGPF